MHKHIFVTLVALCWLAITPGALAQPEPPTAQPIEAQPWVDQGDYRVHFSTFTSDFLQPGTADALGFTRAKDRVLVNVAVTRKQPDGSYSLGVPADISGSATNLMQQQKSLVFKKVAETGATYYLAELRFTNEEMMYFQLSINTPSGDTLAVKFSRKLYVSP